MNYYKNFFHKLLTKVQVETDLIPKELEVVETYHILRSFEEEQLWRLESEELVDQT